MRECNRKSTVAASAPSSASFPSPASAPSNRSLSFPRLGRQKISVPFDGGRLTSDAGGLLLREVIVGWA